jgi:hypothetical protein
MGAETIGYSKPNFSVSAVLMLTIFRPFTSLCGLLVHDNASMIAGCTAAALTLRALLLLDYLCLGQIASVEVARLQVDEQTTFVSDVPTMPETAYGPMLDDQANVEHYYRRPRRNGGLEWRREAKRPNLLGAREIRTG